MHPELARLRSRSDNARRAHLATLNTHLGAITIDAPTITSHEEREAHELVARRRCREILVSEPVRQRLEQLDTDTRNTILAAQGQPSEQPIELDHDEATAGMVDDLLLLLWWNATLVDAITAAPLTEPVVP